MTRRSSPPRLASWLAPLVKTELERHHEREYTPKPSKSKPSKDLNEVHDLPEDPSASSNLENLGNGCFRAVPTTRD